MTNRKKYALIQDDSCHWHIIPDGKQDEFLEFVDAIANYDYDGDEPYPIMPDWVKEIDGPQSIRLIDWEEV